VLSRPKILHPAIFLCVKSDHVHRSTPELERFPSQNLSRSSCGSIIQCNISLLIKWRGSVEKLHTDSWAVSVCLGGLCPCREAELCSSKTQIQIVSFQANLRLPTEIWSRRTSWSRKTESAPLLI